MSLVSATVVVECCALNTGPVLACAQWRASQRVAKHEKMNSFRVNSSHKWLLFPVDCQRISIGEIG